MYICINKKRHGLLLTNGKKKNKMREHYTVKQ
jgi:hypothetical protein